MHRGLFSVYLSNQSISESHPASPLVDFMVKLSTANATTCIAVLESGSLDMILCMYVCNFSYENISRDSRRRYQGSRSRMFQECCAAILRFSQQPDARTIICDHPISALWPQTASLASIFERKLQIRATKWRELGPVIAFRRIACIPALLALSLAHSDFATADLIDLCVDIVEFSKWVTYKHHLLHDLSSL